MKIGLGDQARLERVAAVREAIGPEVKLAVDANHCFSVPNAIKLGRLLEEHDILWFEEPISPEDHRRLCRGDARARHGGGRRRERFHALGLSRRDRAQGDGHRAARSLRGRRLLGVPQDRDAGSAPGVECVPHAWGSAIGLAATVQFLAALPDQPPAFPDAADARVRADAEPVARSPRQEPIEQKKGIVKVPAGAGLGIEIDRDVIGRYRVA